MGDRTGIAWTDATWNPLRGCSRESEGCRHCYAERVASRFSGPGLPYEGLARDGRWTGKVRFIEEHLADPLRWQKPRRIFVNSMSDLFHPNVPDEWIDRIFAVMAISPQHTFQILTKRPERMRRYFENLTERTTRILIECDEIDAPKPGRLDVPLPNVWLGVSVEDQATAEARVPLLLQTPAAVRFVSYEPALGPVDFTDLVIERSAGAETHFDALTCDVGADDDGPYLGRTLDWIIVGGESGPGARPFDVAWARQTIAACRDAGVACFVKQLGSVVVQRSEEWRAPQPPERTWPFPRIVDGEPCGGPLDDWKGMVRFGSRNGEWMHVLGFRDRKGGDPAEWPEDLRVREFPEAPRG